ncbi:MAG: hypothetical protein L3I99_03565 [Sulfurimonas sp.]|nr:hypothetical protein [Sulfurimonas sp.]
MCNFNKQSEDAKSLIHLFMKKSAEALGGVNFLLNLIETMKTHKPNALIHSGKKIISDEALIEWNKVVFKDKFDILEDVIFSHNGNEAQNFNILNNQNVKKSKKILNMVKALAPIEFAVTPKDAGENGGFNFKIFDKIEEGYVSINPIFIAMFFCSTEFIKKALKHNI